MKNIFVVLVAAFLLSGCLAGTSLDDKFMGDIQTAFEPVPRDFDPREAAAETGADVDISALPNTIGTATASDELVAHDQSAAEGSRIVGIHFSAAADEWLNGVGGFTTPTAAQVDAVSAASGGTFKGDIDIGDADTSTETRSLEIGKGRTGDGYARIDFVGDTTYTSYGFRIDREGGPNSNTTFYHRGTGDFNFYASEASELGFYTNGIYAAAFGSTQKFSLSSGTGINEFSTDGTLSGDSDDAVPTEKAVKTYVDATASGDVSKAGTPVNDQVGIWTGDGTIEGDADLTFDGTNLTVGGTITSAGSVVITSSDVDDTPVNGATTVPSSSNWAYDHNADVAAHHAAVTIGTANGLSLSTQALSMAAASTTATGTVELATMQEINIGTDTARTITPDALAGSNLGSKEVAWHIYDSDTDTATGDGKQAFVVPISMDGMNLVDMFCAVADLNSATGGTTTVVLRRVRGISSLTTVDMTSTGVTVNYSQHGASDEIIDTANDDLDTYDRLYLDVDAVTTGAVHKGLGCTAIFRMP